MIIFQNFHFCDIGFLILLICYLTQTLRTTHTQKKLSIPRQRIIKLILCSRTSILSLTRTNFLFTCRFKLSRDVKGPWQLRISWTMFWISNSIFTISWTRIFTWTGIFPSAILKVLLVCFALWVLLHCCPLAYLGGWEGKGEFEDEKFLLNGLKCIQNLML